MITSTYFLKDRELIMQFESWQVLNPLTHSKAVIDTHYRKTR